MSESESVEIVQAEEVPKQGISEDGMYKGYRYRIVQVFERYTRDKAAALELMERFENGVTGALHLVSPDARSMRIGFQAAAQKFLEDVDNG